MAMAFSGIAVINAFAVELFRATGLSLHWASLANVGLCLLSLGANVASALLIDSFGRRHLLLITLSIILSLNISIGALLFAYESARLDWLGLCLIITISLFIIAFAFGPGPICYFLPAELVPQNARSAAQGWASLSQMASRGLLLGIFLPLRNAIGAGFAYLSLFVLPILASLLVLFFHLPETKNRDLSELRWKRRNKAKVAFGTDGQTVGWTSIVVNAEAEEKGEEGGREWKRREDGKNDGKKAEKEEK